jgi:hypothetical protein
VVLFILQIGKGFLYAAKTIRHYLEMKQDSQTAFAVWALGASLFNQAVTCISISYFDQSFIFLYAILAAISSAYSEMMLIATTHKDACEVEDAVIA